jgi:Cellulose binding domain
VEPSFGAEMSWRFQLSKGTAATRGARADIDCVALVLAAVAGLDSCVTRWRVALHVIVTLLIVVASGLAITPVAHAVAAAARLSVSSTWQTGFIAHYTIVNASTAPMTDWRLEFDLPAGESVSHTWSSTLVQYGTHYVLAPANWNRIIAPGGSATGGLRGVLTGFYTPPSNCVLNGQYPCT